MSARVGRPAERRGLRPRAAGLADWSRPHPARVRQEEGRRREPARALRLCIEDTFEAGIALTGTEVKSLRFGEGSIAESYAEVQGDEAG
jgi:SsrA-binding protein